MQFEFVLLFVLGIASLEMSLSQLEELNRTPIPVCYSAHLSHALWIYLLVMPVSDWTIFASS